MEFLVKKKEVVKIQCTCCGDSKKMNSSNFYKSYSAVYKSTVENRMTICKDCVLKLAEEFKERFSSQIKGLYELCKLLDIYYEKSLYEAALGQAEKSNSNVYQIYFQKVLSLPQYRNKTFIDSEYFVKIENENDSEDDEYRDMCEFWGSGGYSQEDYEFLDNEYRKLVDGYDVDSQAQIILFQEICYQRLDIKRKRENGSSVDKELRTLQDLLGSANIKPAQESASMASEQVTFGTLIKKFENEKPIPEPLPEWMSADWIRKYVVTFFFGNLARMMGKENPFKEEYEKEMSKYTVKVDDESDDDY